MPKGFVNLVVILVVIGVGITFYWGKSTGKINLPRFENIIKTETLKPALTPTSVTDETVSWNTYADNEHNFSFKYPLDWVENKSGQISPTEKLFEEAMIGIDKKGVGISVYKGYGNLSAKEFLDKIFYTSLANLEQNDLKDHYISSQTYKTVLADSVEATRLDLIMPPGSRGIAVWITKDNLGILLRSNPVTDGEKILLQILSTFKFLEQEQLNQVHTSQYYCGDDPNAPLEKQCPQGYTCIIAANYPPNGGRCVKQ